MISIFTMPKDFIGEFEIIQRNAIRTWKEECPNSEIILAANAEGVSEVSAQFGIQHLHGVRSGDLGSPLLSSLFQQVKQEARNEILAFINADCMLIGNLEKAVELVRKKFEKFLMIGIRYDSEISQLLPTEDWKDFILMNKGLLHPFARRKEIGKTSVAGTDLFVFPKDLYPEVPPFNIGTFYYDAWLIYDAWRRQIPIIDITPDIMTIHQKHTVKTRTDNFWKEADINEKLCSGKKACRDANFILENGILQRNKSLSLFTHPRYFQGEFDRIQRNAIKSWLASCPSSEIVLLGNAPGNERMALESQRIYRCPEKIAINDMGKKFYTPRIRSIFDRGLANAIHGTLGFISTDLILIGDLEKMIKIARDKFREFLIIGQKWNLKISDEIDFTENWQVKLKTLLKTEGNLLSPSNIDYFIFTLNSLPSISKFPDFLLGRPYWEHWLIYEMLKRNIPVIDAMNVITAIHCTHIRNEKSVAPHQFKIETRINFELIRGAAIAGGNINNSQYIFTKDLKIKKRE